MKFWNAIFLFVGMLTSLPNVHANIDLPTANQFLLQADSLFLIGQHDQAIQLALQARETYQNTHSWNELGTCLNKIARYCDYVGYESKAAYAKKAWAVSQSHFQEGHPIAGGALRQLMEAMAMKGEPDSVWYFGEKAMVIFAQHHQWEDMAWCHIIMAGSYFGQGRLSEMESSLNQAHELSRSYDMDKDVGLLLLSYYSVLYGEQGNFEKAIQFMRTSVKQELSKESGVPIDSFFLNDCYTNLGVIYQRKGDLERAKDSYLRAILWAPSSLPDRKAELYHRIGSVYTGLEQFDAAVASFYSCQAQFLQLAPSPANLEHLKSSYNLTAECYLQLEAPDSVQKYLQQAFQLSTDFAERQTWATKGQLFLFLGQPKEAISALRKALSFDSRGISMNVKKSIWHRSIGDAYQMADMQDSALLAYQHALIAVSTDNFRDSIDLHSNPDLSDVLRPTYFLEALRSKAALLSDMGDLTPSLEGYLLAIQWIDSMRQAYITESSELVWSRTFTEIYEEAIAVCWQLAEQQQDPSYFKTAFGISEKSKANTLLENLQATQAGRQDTALTQDLMFQKEKDLAREVAFYTRSLKLAEEKGDSSKVALYQQYLSAVRFDLAEHKTQMEQQFPSYYRLKYRQAIVSVEELQHSYLADGKALVEYFVGKNQVYAWLIGKETFQAMALGTPQDLHAVVHPFQQAFLDMDSFLEHPADALSIYQKDAFHVYSALLHPLLENLSNSVSHLLIVPDAWLFKIPFEALTIAAMEEQTPDFSKLPYLLHRYHIHYGYSASLWLNNQARQSQLNANIRCLAMAPPQIALQQSLDQVRGSVRELRGKGTGGPLLGTIPEIQGISESFPGTYMWSDQSTPTFFAREAPHYGLLHLAMHGTADLEQRELAFLTFSQDIEDPSMARRLYHYEISQMDLAAQLVVLSACETGVGQYVEGEGVFSLARGFMHAGVPSVVMSLWKVSDQSTAELMPKVYEYLAEGLSKTEALSLAKQSYLQEVSLEQLHPYFWAGFVLLGDGRPLKQPTGWTWWWGIGGLVLLGLAYLGREYALSRHTGRTSS